MPLILILDDQATNRSVYTRLAMLKTGEADIGYLMIGDEAGAIQRDQKLRLAQVGYPLKAGHLGIGQVR